MKQFLNKLPLPACGIILGVISLGNLLNAVFKNFFSLAQAGTAIRLVLDSVGILFLFLILIKILVFPQDFKRSMENPEIFGIFCTFPMSLMLLGDFFAGYFGKGFGGAVWWTGVVLHLLFMVIFISRYVIHFKWPQILPPWYVVFTGFALCGINAPEFAPLWFGKAAFYFGSAAFVVLFILIMVRWKTIPVPRMAEPFFCINAAAGICASAYVRNFQTLNAGVLWTMFAVNLILYVLILIKLPSLFRLQFYPSDAAFSFPFVVSAICSMQLMMGFMRLHAMMPFFKPLVLLQTVIACLMVLYAVSRYKDFMEKPASSHEKAGMKM